MDQKWLAFLREQYPVGSRIRLREMKDPYRPVEPGTMGTLTGIDDIGTFHCNWDSGSSLGLVIGEDSFTVLPPETHLLKLYMPMWVECYERNRWGDYESEPTMLGGDEAVQYADNIAAALLREFHPEESERGLMTYYGEDDGADSKVKSCRITAEVRRDRLWGVAECQVTGKLTDAELASLKKYVSGQSSDGFGEGFEQREIKVGDCELFAHLWSGDDSWSIQTEQERFAPKLAEGLPELCFSTLKSTGELI